MKIDKSEILDAIHNNNICFIQKCIDNKINIDIYNDRDENILLLAIEKENINLIRLIINYISDIDNNYNYYSLSPLHIACEIGNIEIVQILLEYGANTEINDNKLMTPIFYAAQNNHYNIIKLLINYKAKINIMDQYNRLPIHLTTSQKITKFLLKKGSYINSSEYKIEYKIKKYCL